MLLFIYELLAEYYPGKYGEELRNLLLDDCKKNHKTLGYKNAR